MRFWVLIPLLLLVPFLFSCTENKKPSINNEAVIAKEEEQVEKTITTLKNIPLPTEIASIFEVEKFNFDKNLLNPISKSSNYNTTHKKALNFGVYGADLSYVTVYDVTQESIIYMNCAKKLAEELGLTTIFDVLTIEQVENNIENKDSILVIAENCYRKANQYFNENDNEQLAALVLVGGWIEGLYLGTRQAPATIEASLLIEKIVLQKQSLIALISLLETFKNEENETQLINQLKQLNENFIIKNNKDFSKLAIITNDIRNQITN